MLIGYSILFIVALVCTWWIYKKILKIAILKNIVDNPDARKIQKSPVPVLGGVAVFFGMVTAIVVAPIFWDISVLLPILCLMTVMLYIGAIDDIISLRQLLRLIVEILVALVLIFTTGNSLNNFHGLWGIYELPQWVSIPLTVFACVGIINAINLIDGVNGLSSAYCIMTCSLFAAVFICIKETAFASLAIICVGALIPFFCHNVFGKKSKMFIGDSGTLLMGTIISAFVVTALDEDSPLSSCVNSNFGQVAFILAFLAIPVFDTLRVMMMRIIRGTSPFNPDKTHLHHLLFDMGFSHVGTTTTEILANILVIGGWYISYALGASVDVQLYVVILMGMGVTFGFYKFCRIQQIRDSKIFRWLQKVGRWTHVGHTHWFEGFRDFLDRGCE